MTMTWVISNSNLSFLVNKAHHQKTGLNQNGKNFLPHAVYVDCMGKFITDSLQRPLPDRYTFAVRTGLRQR